MKNKKAVLYTTQSFRLVEDIVGPLNTDSALLKIDSCAICGSDLRIFKHGNSRISYPAIIGHEISGTIVASNNPQLVVGDSISLGADIPCGQCSKCKAGQPNLCSENLAIGYQLQGGFSQYMELDSRLISQGPLSKVAKHLPSEITCLGEPLACAINGVEKVHYKRGGSLLIFGAGPIGIMIAYIVAMNFSPSEIIFIEPNTDRRTHASRYSFITSTLSPEECSDQLRNKEFDYVFTCCSVPNVHRQALTMVANGGVINFFGGLPQPSPSFPVVTNDLHYREITLTGSHGSTPSQHKEACHIIENDPEFFKSLVTRMYSLEEIHNAFNAAASGKNIKVVITP